MQSTFHTDSPTGGPKRPDNELLAGLREAIEQRRGHKALGLVKLLRKHPAYGPEVFPLVTRAYEIRLAEMNAAAQHKDAAGLLQMLAEQQPEIVALMSRRPALLLELGGGSGSLLTRYGQDVALTEEVDTWIRTKCHDPRLLARHPALAETHPLKAAALAVLNAWEEVESGAIDEAYARLPRVVGRRSPFIAWRLFIQALNAAYAGSDREAHDCLSRITAESAVRPLADILGRLLAGEPPQSVREKTLRARIVTPSLHGVLEEIDRLLAAGRLSEAQKGFDELIHQPIWSGRSQLLSELSARFMMAATHLLNPCDTGFDGAQRTQEFFSRFRHVPQFSLSFVRCLYWSNADSAEDWGTVMVSCKPSPLLKALIFDRLAAVEMARGDDDYDEDDYDYEDEDEDDAGYGRAVAWWCKSVQLYPLRETFVHWHAEARRQRADMEAALEAWSRAFPEDETPLLELTAIYRSKRTPQKALALFKRLENVAGGRPEVENLRPLLRLDSAAGRLSRGMYSAAEKDLDGISPDGSEFVRVVCATLRWICALRDDGGHAEARRAEWEAAGHPLWAFQTVILLEKTWSMSVTAEKAEANVRLIAESRDDPARLVADYAWLVRFQDAVWSAKEWFPIGASVEDAFRSRAADPAALWDLTVIFCCVPGLSELPVRSMCWCLTGNGLARRDARTPELLACRALLYDPYLAPPEAGLHVAKALKHMEDCMAVAHRLAKASGRMEAVQRVETLADSGRCTIDAKREARLTDAACANLLEQEALISAWADVPAAFKRAVPRQDDISALIKRLGRKHRTPRQPRSSKPESGPDASQLELW